jgi:hypothetical protein
MTIVVKAPNPVPYDDKVTIFLGGSIDMGTAEDWQTRLEKDLSHFSDKLVLVNPRRDDWDSSWKQDPTPGTQFHEQVSWELYHQENVNACVYYFAADSKSPITLLELGLFAAPEVTVVCCPKEFYRYGNVKMVCDRYGIRIVETYEEMISTIIDGLPVDTIRIVETYEEMISTIIDRLPVDISGKV